MSLPPGAFFMSAGGACPRDCLPRVLGSGCLLAPGARSHAARALSLVSRAAA